MAIAQEPTKWTMPLGVNADANDIPDTAPEYTGNASMNSVFPSITQLPLEAGGIAPTRADFNGLFKLIGASIYYMQHGGLFSYSDSLDYDVGAVVKYNNNIYIAIQANGPASTEADPTDPDYWLQIENSLIPTGSYIQFAGSQAPEGFLVCNGGEISRTTYAKLFSVIGTTYGSGDGSTTFNLPNLTDRFLQGSGTSGTVKEAGIPNITGVTGTSIGVSGAPYLSHDGSSGVFTGGNNQQCMSDTGFNRKNGNSHLFFDASKSSTVYGNAPTVQPPALTCLICIKY